MAVANPVRGEVNVNVTSRETGKTKTYTLKLSMNAAAALESGGKSFSQLLSDAEKLSFIAIRDIVWLLLQKYHKDEFNSVEAAGDFIDDAGGIDVFFTSLAELVGLNKAPAASSRTTESDGPLEATAPGTGPSSTSSGAAVSG